MTCRYGRRCRLTRWGIQGPDESPGKGLRFEAAEVARRVAAGLLESPVMPPAESVAGMEPMDTISTQTVALDTR